MGDECGWCVLCVSRVVYVVYVVFGVSVCLWCVCVRSCVVCMRACDRVWYIYIYILFCIRPDYLPVLLHSSLFISVALSGCLC